MIPAKKGNLEPGCLAMIVRGPRAGKVVTCIKYMGRVPFFIERDLWEIDSPMNVRNLLGEPLKPEPYAPASMLVRIDGNEDEFKQEELEYERSREDAKQAV